MSIARELSQVASKVSIDENDFDRLVLGDGSPIKLGGDLVLDGYAFSANAGAVEFIIAGDQRLEIDYSSNTSTTEILSPIDNLSITSHSSRDVIIQGLTYPKVDGTNGQVLITDGAGNLSFADVAGASSYGDTDVASYLSTNGYDTATNIISSITDSAPATLDTLNELAAALGDDANFSTTVTNSIATKIGNVVEDTTPQLGGNLDTNGNSIGYGVVELSFHPNGFNGTSGQLVATGDADSLYLQRSSLIITDMSYVPLTIKAPNSLGGNPYTLTLPTSAGSNGQVLTTDGSGTLSFTTINGGISNVVEDTTPQLGGNLDTNGFEIAPADTANNAQTDTLTIHAKNSTNSFPTDGGGNLILRGGYGYGGGDVTLMGGEATDFSGIAGDVIIAGGSKTAIPYDGDVKIQGLTYPSSDGTNGQVLTTNGSGVLSFQDASSPFAASLFHTLDNPNDYGTSANDNFGVSVAISGNYAIAGAHQEDQGGDFGQGNAYIFDVTTGALLHTLDNPNPYPANSGDQFGYSVAISGNHAIVSAYLEDDGGGADSGKAYIFDVTTGALLHTLDNPNAYNTSTGDQFGAKVAISGNYAIVSATGEDDASGNQSGKAYIFNVTTGALLHTLDNPNVSGTSADDRFGSSVAISGNYAIVGAYLEDDGGNVSGTAYIYNVTTGSLLHTLDNPNAYDIAAGDRFGSGVAISGNYAIVGAYNESDAEGFASGKAYIFDVTTGALLHTLDNPNPYGTSASDYFGWSAGIAGNYAIVSAYREDVVSYGQSGKAYIFDVATGALVATIDNPNPYGTSANDNFGYSVAISGNYAIVSAYTEDDAGGVDSGKVYIYQLSAPGYTPTADEFTQLVAAAGPGFAQQYATALLFG
jgi:hypothetical protein